MNKDKNVSINDLSRIRKIINLVINIIETSINDYSEDKLMLEKNKKLLDFLIGNKENVVSIITKLTNLLLKVMPLEEQLNHANDNVEKLNNEDIEIIMKYIDKCNFLFNKSSQK